MAKKDYKSRNDKKFERTIIRNWIICGVSLAVIIILYCVGK